MIQHHVLSTLDEGEARQLHDLLARRAGSEVEVVLSRPALSPDPALAMLRFHSFYAAHREGEYSWLMDDHDREMFHWVRLFNQYDLYSKDHAKTDPRSKRGHGFSTATSSEEKGSHRLWPGGVRRELAEVDHMVDLRWLANKP
jgi:hypothetical protein